MQTRIVIVGLAALTGMTAGTARTGPADDRISVAEAATRDDTVTPEGKRYQEAVGQAFGKEQGATVGQCAKAVKRPDLSAFELFLRVDAAGAAEEVLVKPRTNVSECVQGKLAGWKVPGPPHAGLWVKVAVNLKRR